jgi:hypothetical protein
MGAAVPLLPLYTCLLAYVLTPRSRVFPEKLNVLKKFPAFYGTRRFITTFTRARHLSLSWARLIQSMPAHPTSRRSILILSSHLRLGLPGGPLPSGFPTKALYALLLSPIRATCPAHLCLLDCSPPVCKLKHVYRHFWLTTCFNEEVKAFISLNRYAMYKNKFTCRTKTRIR